MSPHDRFWREAERRDAYLRRQQLDVWRVACAMLNVFQTLAIVGLLALVVRP